jgi:transposase
MQANAQEQKQYNDQFKHAAVQFFHNSGRALDEVAQELGLRPTDLRHWKKKYPYVPVEKGFKPTSRLAKLREENKALRDEISNLRVQWDVLKTTLGILSTTICPQENHK